MNSSRGQLKSQFIWKILLSYFSFSVIWIVLSDFFLFQFIPDDFSLGLSIIKGLTFVVVSSFLIYLLLKQTLSDMLLVEHELETSQHELQDLGLKLEFLLNQIPVIFWELDADGIIKRIMGKNLETLNIPPHVIVGNSIFDLYKDYPEVITKAHKVLNGEPVQWQFSLRDRHYENYYEPIFEAGDVVGALGLGIDITDTTTMKMELKSTQKSLRAIHRLDLLGTVLSKVTHDMNNHFTLISGYLELIEENPTRNNINSYLPKLSNRIAQAQNLLQNLLSYSKMSQDEKMVTLESLIDDLQPILDYLSSEKVVLEFHLDDQITDYPVPKIKFDAIITNLLSNAVDALPDGKGYVSLNITLDINEKDDPNGSNHYLLIEVADNGVGIPSDILPHIFDPLFSTKSEESGTGLGLSIVTDMVQSMSGFIDVDTGSKGTIMRIYLPYDKQNKLTTHGSSVDLDYKTPQKQFTALILDDSESIIEYIETIVSPYSSELYLYSDPIEALKVIDELDETIDVFIVDAVMPEFDGVSFSKRVNSKYPNSQIILMSGYKVMDVISSTIDNTLYLSKPFTPAKLLHFISTCLES